MADAQSAPSSAAQGWNQFLGWWQQQLKECVPQGVRDKLAKARRPVMWSPTDDRFWSEAAALNESKPFSHSALAQRGGAAALVVGEANGFRREIEMPLAVQDRLQQVLGYELDRLTPLKPGELYYDFRVSRRNLSGGTCTVELVAAPKMRVDPMLLDAKQRNVDVTRMLLAAADVDSPLDLLKSAKGANEEVSAKQGWITPALGVLCGLLAIALVAFPLWQMRQHVIALQPVEASAKADAEAASILQRQLEKQIGEYNLPLTRKHGAPLSVQLLDDLSKRLPDDTWAQSVEIRSVPNQKGKEVVLQGETGSGGKILQIVQESPLIKDPVFKATMTRVAPNAERFHIAGELVVAELPKPLMLADGAGVITVPVSPAAPAGSPATAKTIGAAPVPTPPSGNPSAGTATPVPAAPGQPPPGSQGDAAKKSSPQTGSAPAGTPTPAGASSPGANGLPPGLTPPQERRQ